MEITARPEHFEMLVEGQKSLEQVLLIPEAVLFENPILRVLGWQEYIVYVDNHAWIEPGQNVQVFELHVAANLQDVAGIDKKNIVFL